MQNLLKTLALCLFVLPVSLHAETFLNDSVLMEPVLSDSLAELGGTKAVEVMPNEEYKIKIEVNPLPKPQYTDPGFTPSHEVMRETESKREAEERLWEAIFSQF
ncbi:hypothetical protein MD588_06865 [Photobacterium sp. SDRW27]|uniref:hypothetical protein n=1 Tax=Photobacterium obscurum TaxID=2829490 RepID=UPI002244A0F9|nr:hypothetical protein [Photobacterium obscurum]MCW8328525.1 hypothetical protein [Photobacterium obscurum]